MDVGTYPDLVRRAGGRDRRRTVADSWRQPAIELDDRLAKIISTSALSEDIGGQAAQALLAIDFPSHLRSRLVRAAWDEVIHSSYFTELKTRLGLREDDSSAQPAMGLYENLGVARSASEFIVLHSELEALALDAFVLLSRCLEPGPVRDVYRSIAVDEATHVKLGLDLVDYAREHLDPLGSDDLARVLSAARSLSPFRSIEQCSSLCELVSAEPGPIWEKSNLAAEHRQTNYELLLES